MNNTNYGADNIWIYGEKIARYKDLNTLSNNLDQSINNVWQSIWNLQADMSRFKTGAQMVDEGFNYEEKDYLPITYEQYTTGWDTFVVVDGWLTPSTLDIPNTATIKAIIDNATQEYARFDLKLFTEMEPGDVLYISTLNTELDPTSPGLNAYATFEGYYEYNRDYFMDIPPGQWFITLIYNRTSTSATPDVCRIKLDISTATASTRHMLTTEDYEARFEQDLKSINSFNPSKTQVLKNVNGTLTWVDDEIPEAVSQLSELTVPVEE